VTSKSCLYYTDVVCCRILKIGASVSNICGILTNLLPRLERDLVCIARGYYVISELL